MCRGFSVDSACQIVDDSDTSGDELLSPSPTQQKRKQISDDDLMDLWITRTVRPRNTTRAASPASERPKLPEIEQSPAVVESINVVYDTGNSDSNLNPSSQLGRISAPK